jgi:hypothetical protein
MVSAIAPRRRVPISKAMLAVAFRRMGGELMAAGDRERAFKFLAEADRLRAATHGSSVKLMTGRQRR